MCMNVSFQPMRSRRCEMEQEVGLSGALIFSQEMTLQFLHWLRTFEASHVIREINTSNMFKPSYF